MKFLTAIFLTLTLISVPTYSIASGGEVKEVCKDKKDKDGKVIKNKDGKPEQTCKKIKVHKKLEGTKVPEKK
jgi:hypothetical protein